MSKVESTKSPSRLIILLIVLAMAVAAYFMLDKTESNITVSEEGLEEILTPQSDSLTHHVNHAAEAEVDLKGLEITPLDLTLLGTISSDTPDQSSATIQSRLQVRTYFIDDQIAYTNAILTRIENDRVILLNDGQEQVLLIQGTASSGKPDVANNLTAADNENSEQSANLTAAEIGNRPSKLEHIVSLDKYDDLAVSAGMNPKLYRDIGFKEGDKLRTVNGIDATDFDQLTLIDNAIGNTQMVEFVVLRDGRLVSLYLDIPSKALTLSN